MKPFVCCHMIVFHSDELTDTVQGEVHRKNLSSRHDGVSYHTMLKGRMTAVFSSLYVRIMLMVETNQIKTSLPLYIYQTDLKQILIHHLIQHLSPE